MDKTGFVSNEVLSSTIPLSERHPTVSLLELFCAVDDFLQAFEPLWQQRQLSKGERQRQRAGVMCESVRLSLVYFTLHTLHAFSLRYEGYVGL